MALSLGGATPSLSPRSRWSRRASLAQLVPLQESSLALVGTLLILTIESPSNEADLTRPKPRRPRRSRSRPARPSRWAKACSSKARRTTAAASGDEEPGKPEEPPADQAPAQPMSWERFILRTDEALEQLDRELRDLAPSSDERGAEQGTGSPIEGRADGLALIAGSGSGRPRSRAEQRDRHRSPCAGHRRGVGFALR